MRNAAKIIFALLLSVLLAATGGVASASTLAACPTKCVCGSCPKPCCVAQPVSTPQPVAPVSVAVHDQVPLFVAVIAYLSVTTPAAPAELSPVHFSLPSSATVPLYQRNCAYLI